MLFQFVPGAKLLRPEFVSKLVIASSPAAEMFPVVVIVSEVLPLVLLAVPVWSSGLEVATPLHSLSCAIEFAPLEPVLNVTYVIPAETFR